MSSIAVNTTAIKSDMGIVIQLRDVFDIKISDMKNKSEKTAIAAVKSILLFVLIFNKVLFKYL
jgi:hypothetical protein